MAEYIYSCKTNLKTVSISELNLELPDLRNTEEPISVAIAKWMMGWIDRGLREGKISVGNLLPSKSEFAYYLGVSIGTMQNAIRYIEDLNYVESKQRVGTIIKDKDQKESLVRKLTSKREIAIKSIKRFIISNKIRVGEFLPSSRVLAEIIDCSPNTTRLALEYLCSTDILSHIRTRGTDGGWQVSSTNFARDFNSKEMEQATLADKIEQDLRDYIDKNLEVGDKIPAHNELAQMFRVSIKTVHDALQNLIDSGILYTRRGRYGTSVIRLPKDANSQKRQEKFIFAPAQEAAFYYYEKTQHLIKGMIANNYEIGAKLPSIAKLSKELDLSPNTIRKALHNLAKEGYITFARGRYGGTFVIDLPNSGEETFKWLAVNPQYAKMYTTTSDDN